MAVTGGAVGRGIWVAAARKGEPDFPMYVTDQICERLLELQLTLGEGPCHDVLASAAPVLAADLDDAESARRARLRPQQQPAAYRRGPRLRHQRNRGLPASATPSPWWILKYSPGSTACLTLV